MCDTYELTTRTSTIGVATPTKVAMYGDAYYRDADKSFHICIVDEPWDALRQDIIDPTLSVVTTTIATPTSVPNKAKRSIAMPHCTILTNRHQASRCRQKFPHVSYMSLVKAQDKTLANRRRALRDADSRFHI
jgi:hypothetical protein